MKVIPVSQGTQDWLELRAKHNTASEAPAVMGASKYMSRSDLMKQKATGITPDVDGAKQALFNRGHAAEEGARAILERLIDEDLYPVTCVCERTNLLASLDGLNMSGTIAFECKLWNERLVEQVRAGDLEPHYYWQLEQELLVTGAEKVIFVTSDGTEDKFVSMDYRAVPGRAEQLIAAWGQFDKDLATYTPVEAAPVAIGRAPETLPALHIVLKGEVSASNLDEFKQVALTAIRSVNRDLQTDQDFADSAKARKWCQDIEDRVAAAKDHALSQTATIDTLFRALDEVSAEAAAVRLALEKLEKARTQSLNEEIVLDGKTQFATYMTVLNAAMPAPYMPQIAVDFGITIKGLRTVSSKKNAVATELARVRIIANEHATRIQGNLKTLDANPAMAFLFSDKAQIVLKQPDDLMWLVKARISEHQAAEAAKEAATRERIRAEEQAKAEKDARDKLAREAEAQRLAIEATARANAAAELAAAKQLPEGAELSPAAQALNEQEGAARFASSHPKAANVVPITRAAPALQAAPTTPPTLKLGEIGTRLGFSLTGDFLKTLGFEPAARDKSAMLFHEAEFCDICAALVSHIQGVQVKRAA